MRLKTAEIQILKFKKILEKLNKKRVKNPARKTKFLQNSNS